MSIKDLNEWDGIFCAKAKILYPPTDPSHDFLHVCRVVKNAVYLAEKEKADLNVVLPAAWFHDFVNVPKNDRRRNQVSTLSAEAAVEYLDSVAYPAQYFDGIRHAIAAHSFSAGIKTETLEADVVQDADRLDALGAIGIARCFSTSALMQRPYYCPEDPWSQNRAPDDKTFTIDHFPVKLFKIAETMKTKTAQHEAKKRLAFMQDYLEQMKSEVSLFTERKN